MRQGLIGISRHRIGMDGNGVTTLVAFHGCPLRCKHCLNVRALRDDGVWRTYTPNKLFDEVKKDDLYFVATCGGVTFGGGEPLLYPDFLIAFRQLCAHRWKINVETSLNVDSSNIASLVYDIDHWIVDIKDMNPKIYQAYTGKDNKLVIENLKTLVNVDAKITARVPLIPGYNTPYDVAQSISRLNEMGITDIDQFTYIIKSDNHEYRQTNM